MITIGWMCFRSSLFCWNYSMKMLRNAKIRCAWTIDPVNLLIFTIDEPSVIWSSIRNILWYHLPVVCLACTDRKVQFPIPIILSHHNPSQRWTKNCIGNKEKRAWLNEHPFENIHFGTKHTFSSFNCWFIILPRYVQVIWPCILPIIPLCSITWHYGNRGTWQIPLITCEQSAK